VKKLIVVGSSAIGALAVSALLGGGVASADDFAGQTYADASSAAGNAGLSVVVASRVGATSDEGNCLVTRSQTAPFASGNDGVHVSSTVQFYLNCNGGVASATKAGNSLASPEGRTARAAEEQAAAQAAAQEEAALAAVSTPDE
jgi:hypothetical protein